MSLLRRSGCVLNFLFLPAVKQEVSRYPESKSYSLHPFPCSHYCPYLLAVDDARITLLLRLSQVQYLEKIGKINYQVVSSGNQTI
jgi:hypothetical protein